VAASWERINAIAKAAKAAGDPRRMDELRADIFTDLLIGEGVAVGEPITHGGLDQPESTQARHSATQQSASGSAEAPAGPVDLDTPWPRAPADPDLLDPAADPPLTQDGTDDGRTDTDEPAPSEAPVQDEGDPAVDLGHEQLRRFWLAGFDQLATTRPGSCPHCGHRPTAAPGVLPAPRRGVVDLQMSVYTLMGLDQLPAELSGFGPLLADIARQVVAQRPDLQWRFSVYTAPRGAGLYRPRSGQR
jgi:hypothetical protein